MLKGALGIRSHTFSWREDVKRGSQAKLPLLKLQIHQSTFCGSDRSCLIYELDTCSLAEYINPSGFLT